MPRPIKYRRVCRMPQCTEFIPVENSKPVAVVLTVDEYETIRLIDREGRSQEDCAMQMQVGRSTVQRIYNSARKKLADALVGGMTIRIEGGDYRLCDSNEGDCSHSSCHRRINSKTGGIIMKIAATFENNKIFQHFGRTQQFKVYTVEDKKISWVEIVDTNGTGHGALAGFLKEMGVNVLICGGMGMGARNALAAAGIEICGGVTGDADMAVVQYLQGTLDYSASANCDHHDHHHGDGHNCGNHGCGDHGCHK
ncbi:MAG: DUF134 domain-containing protein [Oscillospiraceae bacterium]|nr:DUF134 domain-containing protein [Oscillospiraceae bacterium]